MNICGWRGWEVWMRKKLWEEKKRKMDKQNTVLEILKGEQFLVSNQWQQSGDKCRLRINSAARWAEEPQVWKVVTRETVRQKNPRFNCWLLCFSTKILLIGASLEMLTINLTLGALSYLTHRYFFFDFAPLPSHRVKLVTGVLVFSFINLLLALSSVCEVCIPALSLCWIKKKNWTRISWLAFQ